MITSVVLEEDGGALKAVAERALRNMESISMIDKEEFIKHTSNNIDSFLDSTDCVFLKYKIENQVVAYILVKHFWNLSDLFVLPSYQKQGIGSSLLNQAIEICRKHTVGYIRLNTSTSAKKFYLKHGFAISKNHKSRYENAIPMEIQF